MSKREFRAVENEKPRYPNRAALAIAAVTSLLLIGASVGVHYRRQLVLLYQRYLSPSPPPPVRILSSGVPKGYPL